jgi:hypothetical protein
VHWPKQELASQGNRLFMLKSKTIFTISVLAAAISLTACQPKDKEPQTPATQTTAASEVDTTLKLVGDTEKLQFELPE